MRFNPILSLLLSSLVCSGNTCVSRCCSVFRLHCVVCGVIVKKRCGCRSSLADSNHPLSWFLLNLLLIVLPCSHLWFSCYVRKSNFSKSYRCVCVHIFTRIEGTITHANIRKETSEKRKGACVDREILEDQDVLVVFRCC